MQSLPGAWGCFPHFFLFEGGTDKPRLVGAQSLP